MKILFVSTLYHPYRVGGAEKIAQIVVEAIRDAGHEPVVIATSPKAGIATGEVNGVKVYYVGLRNLYWPHAGDDGQSSVAKAVWHAVDRYNPLMARAVNDIIRTEKPAVVNTHNMTGFSTALWPVAKSHGLRIYHTLHDYSLLCPRVTMLTSSGNCAKQCRICYFYTRPSQRYSALVDGVIGVSQFTLDRHLQAGYFPNAKVKTVIHNALSAPPNVPAPSKPTGDLRIGYVGRLAPSKGVENLLQAVSRLEQSNWRLVVAGRGKPEYEAYLKQHYGNNPNIEFLGFVDPHEAYRQIDVLVVPSLWEEPLGMVVLEAYYHGLPVIASRCGGLPEIIEPGRTGILYEPSDPHGLSTALNQLLEQSSLVQEMRPWILDKAKYFEIDRLKQQYLSMLTN
jgi:glycosyltransferase involved in cell wall biosynthesis